MVAWGSLMQKSGRWALVCKHPVHGADDPGGVIGFAEKAALGWNLLEGDLPVSGRDDDLQGRPAVADIGGQLDPVHAARHVDIGEDEADARVLCQDLDCLGGIAGFMDMEARIVERIDDIETQNGSSSTTSTGMRSPQI